MTALDGAATHEDDRRLVVQLRRLVRGHRCQHSIGDERLRPAQVAAVRREDLSADEGGDVVGDGGQRVAGQLGDHADVGLVAQDAHGASSDGGGLVQTTEATSHGAHHGVGRARLGGEQLVDEERDAATGAVHLVDLGVSGPRSHRPDLFGDRVARQWPRVQHRARGQEPVERLGRGDRLTGADGEHDEARKLLHGVGQQVERLHGGGVGPLEVVDDEQHRLIGRQVLEHPPHGVREISDAALVTVGQREQRLAGPVERMHAGAGAVRQHAEPVPEHAEADGVAHRRTPCVQHAPTGVGRKLSDVSQKTGLTDTRRPFNTHQTAPAACGTGDQSPQDSSFRVAF